MPRGRDRSSRPPFHPPLATIPADHAAGDADQDRSEAVHHFRRVTFQAAEVAVPRELFAAILEPIQWFGVPPPLVHRG